MDRIWAESQLNRLLWGASNRTNFSTVSASAQTEMGSTKAQATSNEQLLLFSFYSQQSERVLGETMCISINSPKCIYKWRAGPAAIPFLLRGHPASAAMRTVPITAGLWWNVRWIPHRYSHWIVMEEQLAIIKPALAGKWGASVYIRKAAGIGVKCGSLRWDVMHVLMLILRSNC